ncbi:MAG: hypothetical protein IPK19_41265 [Chloroflexi bacterium]|nr:hypothetical protein [Chloroflexota bacterium]
MPAGTYIPQTTTGAKPEAALDFLGLHRLGRGRGRDHGAGGPERAHYLIKGLSPPDTVLPAVQDLAAYIDPATPTRRWNSSRPSRDRIWSRSASQ